MSGGQGCYYNREDVTCFLMIVKEASSALLAHFYVGLSCPQAGAKIIMGRTRDE